MARKLEEYAAKRNFKKTAEPAPGRVGKSGPLSPGEESQFFIQRHDASHLHYDFRLLIDGTLKSWAVPKGPSLDPAVKRLAVEVEDHPLSYGDFEGTIPEGEYGGGSVMLWDRGDFELLGELDALAQLEKGDLKFRLKGTKLHGEFALVRTRAVGGKHQWLLIKKKDDAAVAGWDIEKHALSVKTKRDQTEIAKGKSVAGGRRHATPPAGIQPMLATLVDSLPEGPGWAYEVKWDGVRALCTVGADRVELRSRNGLSYTRQFPELQSLVQSLHGHHAIVDGEIVVLDERGRSSFQLLQPRLKSRGASSPPVALYLFDLLYLDGEDLRGHPFADRKRLLTGIFKAVPGIHLSEHFVATAQSIVEAARQNGLEGIIAKRLDSSYSAGRSRAWVKFKFHQRQEFAVCGWTVGKRQISALVLGLRQGSQWVWCGNVGTGFNQTTIADLLRDLLPTELKSPVFSMTTGLPAAHWVKPTLVVEIEFAEWTADGKLRAPVFLGIRPDKKPTDCKREEAKPVAQPELLLTHRDKIYFPEDGITKGQLLDYYDAAADLILPYLKDRPLSLRRYPGGIHGEAFFQKNLPDKTPGWLETIEIYSEDSKRNIRYAIAQNRESLLYLVNLGCIDQNPWMSRIQTLDNPDFVLVDLDPHECSFARVVEAALHVRELLEEKKLKTWVKTSGGDGMHVVVPLAPKQSYAAVSALTKELAELAVERWPELFTAVRSLKTRPKNRVYFDHLQVGRGKTIAAPYVVRAKPGAPVGTPLAWEEVKKTLKPEKFNIKNILRRVAKVGDLFAGVLGPGQKLKTR